MSIVGCFTSIGHFIGRNGKGGRIVAVMEVFCFENLAVAFFISRLCFTNLHVFLVLSINKKVKLFITGFYCPFLNVMSKLRHCKMFNRQLFLFRNLYILDRKR